MFLAGQKMNALLVMLVVLRVCGWIVLIVFFLFRFCSFSEVMNGNEHSASSNIATTSLFCAAKHDS